MTTKTCGTCKHKGEPITKTDWDTDEDIDTGYFTCDRIKHDEKTKYKQGQAAIVIDGSGYYAALCVEDDFGCIQWQEN